MALWQKWNRCGRRWWRQQQRHRWAHRQRWTHTSHTNGNCLFGIITIMRLWLLHFGILFRLLLLNRRWRINHISREQGDHTSRMHIGHAIVWKCLWYMKLQNADAIESVHSSILPLNQRYLSCTKILFVSEHFYLLSIGIVFTPWLSHKPAAVTTKPRNRNQITFCN